MTDNTDDDHVQPVTSRLPIHTGPDGQACRGNVDDTETAEALAAAVEQEADNLDCRAITHTRRPSIP